MHALSNSTVVSSSCMHITQPAKCVLNIITHTIYEDTHVLCLSLHGIIVSRCLSLASLFIAQNDPFFVSAAGSVDGRGYIRPFGCGCGGCTISSIVKGCPQPNTEEEVPIFKVSSTHPLTTKLCYSEAKQWELEEKTREIQEMFVECIRSTAHLLQEKDVKISEVEEFLLPALAASHSLYELAKCGNHNRLLSFLIEKRLLSWFNYKLLDDLVAKFLQGVFSLESYKNAFKEYASGRVEEYEGVEFGLPVQPGDKVLILKIDSEYRNIKVLWDISRLQSSISQILGQRYTLLHLVTFDCSILTLEFLIPHCLYNELFPLSQQQLAELSQVGVDTGVLEASNRMYIRYPCG